MMIKYRDGVGLNYIVNQTKKPKATLIICHGFLDNLKNYDGLARDFNEAHYDVVRFDARGHGNSLTPKGDVESYELMLDDIDMFVGVAQELNPEKPVYLLGASMGGLLGSLYQVKYPGKLSALIFLAGAVGVVPMVQGQNGRLLKMGGTLAKGFYVELLKEGFKIHTQSFNPEGKAAATLRFVKTVFNDGGLKLNATMDEIDVPVFMAQGTDDDMVPLAVAQTFYDRIGSTNKRLKIYEGIGHVIWASDAKPACLKDIIEWLKEVEDETN